MQIQQLRNATILLTLGKHTVDSLDVLIALALFAGACCNSR